MKKISLLKGIALSVAALMVFSLSGCDYINKLLDGINSGSHTDSPKPTLTISQTEISFEVGDTVQLTAIASDGAAVSWASLDTEIATVVDGLVTGMAEGKTTIWAETSALMATCSVKVSPAPEPPPEDDTLVISPTSLSLEAGKTATLTATCSIEGATVLWSSSNTTVATVSNGTVTAKTKGTTTITASVLVPDGTLTAICSVTVTQPKPVLPEGSYKDGYELIWYDEFEGNSLDTTKWGYQTGTQDKYSDSPAYWGNDELQYYTQDAVTVSGGSLKITATKQLEGDRPYTSGRILTRDKKSWTYGYFEARMKTPTGNGMWPAFWMLPQPTNSAASSANEYGTWPLNGEIDIMEAKGRLNNVIDTTIHFGNAWPENQYISNNIWCGYPTDGYALSSATDNWHTYAVDWTKDYIAWYADGVQVMKLTNDRWFTPSSSVASAPFDKPFYILLNLAVGGRYDSYNEPDYATFVSKSMYVDYVRVYKAV